MPSRADAPTLETYGNLFYEIRKTQLEKDYPGFNKQIFRRHLEDFAREIFNTQRHPLKQFYSEGLSHQVDSFFDQLERGVPLEYITHKSHFYQSELYVNRHVLIPRPETEILVEMVMKEVKRMAPLYTEALKICDVGTGCGAIILSVLRDSPYSIEASATDISKDALVVAKRNAYRLGFTFNSASYVRFYHCDRLADITEKQHIIVSNPPYIKKSADLGLVHSQVDQYEPHMALYLEDDDYDKWYGDFFCSVKELLYSEGLFLMEGHEDHLESLSILATELGFKKSELYKDFTGELRFLCLRP